MRAWMGMALSAAMVACSAGTTKDDTDAAGDTDLVEGDTDQIAGDTDEAPADTDADVLDCPLPADFGAVTLVASDAAVTENGTRLSLVLNDPSPRDELSIELYGSTSTFPDQPAPGVYELSGADLNYATCGLCLLLLADIEESTPAAYYFPTSGTVTLTETTTGIRGSLSDVVFARVSIDPETFVSTPIDACTTTLSSLEFAGDFPL